MSIKINQPIALLFRLNNGYGTGHFMRMQLLQQELHCHGVESILICENNPGSHIPGPTSSNEAIFFLWETLQQRLTKLHFLLIVLDGRDHNREDIVFYRQYAHKIFLLDDYGNGRAIADYCVDTLHYPGNTYITPAKKNIFRLDFLILGQNKKANPSQKVKPQAHDKTKVYDLFVYWGMNDPFNMENQGLAILKKMLADQIPKCGLSLRIAIFTNNLKTKNNQIASNTKNMQKNAINETLPETDGSDNFRQEWSWECIDWFTYEKDFDSFAHILQQSKICLTYFSMTMYEAWIMDCIPVLFGPTQYHYDLAQALILDPTGQNMGTSSKKKTVYTKKENYSIFFPQSSAHGMLSWEHSMIWILRNWEKLQKTIARKPDNLSFGGVKNFASWLMAQLPEVSNGAR